ncbi:superoxide dismutase family protein [Pseudalkalibacillus sp. Hm43]|uniref:superoxide dismutase family protein n=1 Tax=Pseudalkalibacillus sp. Hm43 TaxID=3450742 RepID=UPI003F41F5E6
MNKWLISTFAAFLVISGLAACAYQDQQQAKENESVPVNVSNQANHHTQSYKDVEIFNPDKEKIGHARLAQTPKGVMIQLKVSNISPGVHGYHIHETGKCEAPDFKSAGEHFNPVTKEHGFENPKGYHAGDLPNLKVDEDGMVSMTTITKHVTLEKGKANSLVDKDGSALVIHEKADDYKTNPAGDAGARIACGVIK